MNKEEEEIINMVKEMKVELNKLRAIGYCACMVVDMQWDEPEWEVAIEQLRLLLDDWLPRREIKL